MTETISDASSLSDLLARVEEAAGPDRELGDAIIGALIPVNAPDAGEFYGDRRCVTASLDAAVALVERVLPGWIFEKISDDASGEIGDGYKAVQGQSATRPLAILAALLRSRVALEEAHRKYDAALTEAETKLGEEYGAQFGPLADMVIEARAALAEQDKTDAES